MKPPEREDTLPESNMNVVCVSYILHRKGDDNWMIEHTRYVSKPINNLQQTVEEIAKFYGKSLEILK